MNATDLADYLVERGMPFRAAHDVAGRVVQYCLTRGKRIEELSLAEFKGFSSKIEKVIYNYLFCRMRWSTGGAPGRHGARLT